MTTKTKQLNLLQLIRGLATVLVVIRHATGNSIELLQKDFLFNIFAFGSSAVDIFFVLSGFIITYTSLKGGADPKELTPFLKRRFIRIYPTYWIITSLFLGIQILLPMFYNTTYPYSAANLLSTYLLFPGHIMVNGVSWTLSYEVFFYLLFSLVFLFSNKKMIFGIFLIYALSVITSSMFMDISEDNIWLNLVFFPMNVEFFMGVLAALVVNRIPKWSSIPLIVLGVIYFTVSALVTDLNTLLDLHVRDRIIQFGVPSFLVILGVVKYELTHEVRVAKVFLLLGESSYSLYLLHLPVIAACTKLIVKFNITNGLMIQLLLISVIIAICWGATIFYKLIERPVMLKLNVLMSKKKRNFSLDSRTGENPAS